MHSPRLVQKTYTAEINIRDFFNLPETFLESVRDREPQSTFNHSKSEHFYFFSFSDFKREKLIKISCASSHLIL